MSDLETAKANEKLKPLNCDPDAKRWTEEFLCINPQEKTGLDFGIMVGWFANAIMCGMDVQRWKMEKELSDARAEIERLKGQLKDNFDSYNVKVVDRFSTALKTCASEREKWKAKFEAAREVAHDIYGDYVAHDDCSKISRFIDMEIAAKLAEKK